MENEKKFTVDEVFEAMKSLSEDERDALLDTYKISEILHVQNNTEIYEKQLEDIKEYISKLTMLKFGIIHMNITLKSNLK